MLKKTFLQYILTSSLIALLFLSCNRLDITGESSITQAQETDNRLSGLWSGEIDGDRPYFNNNPLVTIDLIQSNRLLKGIIRTSDGAFKNDSLTDGTVNDTILSFRAEQSDFYTGSVIEFSGIIQDDSITGVWRSTQGENGSWFAIRKS